MMMNSTILYRSWFPFTNALSITVTICDLAFGIIFILIILCNKTHRSVSNFLAANTALSIMFLALSILIIAINMWECDNHPEQCIGNEACLFRDYINDAATMIATYSLAVQSIHRLVVVTYAKKVRFQKYQLRLILCIIQWSIGFIFPVYFIYIQPQLKYDPISYVCVIGSDSNSFLTIYLTLVDAVVPFTIIIGVYIRIVVYVRQSRRLPASKLSDQRQLRMAKHLFFLSAVLALGSITGTIFQSMKPPPDYQNRIYYMSVTIISFCGLLYMFFFTPQVKKWLLQQKNKINALVHPQANPTPIYVRSRH